MQFLTAGSEMAKSENVQVAIRCRPLTHKELDDDHKDIILIDEVSKTITIKNPNNEEEKTFTFDNIFSKESSQIDIYDLIAKPLVESVFEGYNGTIFAYGQTGTGKTYTMEGTESDLGIISRSFLQIFKYISEAGDDKKFLVRASYLEIYNEEVRDLLSKDLHKRLDVVERPDVGVNVKNLLTIVVNSQTEMEKIMRFGNKNRACGTTNMNEHSSRSHAIFTVTLECSRDESNFRMGKLHLVDLAGSERQGKTGSTGLRLKEASKINLSLSTLGTVISALSSSNVGSNVGSLHVPYRNSKLTHILKDSLGGNAKTVMIANVGPADYNYEETLSTLRYANRAKNIKNSARINEDPKDAMLRKFQKEIEELQKRLQENEEESGEEEEIGEEGDNKTGSSQASTPGSHGRKHATALSDAKIKSIQSEIARDKKMLADRKDMLDEEKKIVIQKLEQRELELEQARNERDALSKKLARIEEKILMGGVNLLEKAETQQKLLGESKRELADRRRRREALRAAVQEKEAEKMNIEERYSDLREEALGKTDKLKRVWEQLLATKSEMSQVKREHQTERESVVDEIRVLNRRSQLYSLAIDSFVPEEYIKLIRSNATWNEEAGEWQLRCIAYTGNNMRIATGSPTDDLHPGEEDENCQQHFDGPDMFCNENYFKTDLTSIKPKSNIIEGGVSDNTLHLFTDLNLAPGAEGRLKKPYDLTALFATARNS